MRKPLSTKNRRTPSPPRSMSLASAKNFVDVGLKWLTRTARTAKARKASNCTMCGSGVEGIQTDPNSVFLRLVSKRTIPEDQLTRTAWEENKPNCNDIDRNQTASS